MSNAATPNVRASDALGTHRSAGWLVLLLLAGLLVLTYADALLNAVAAWKEPHYSLNWITLLFAVAVFWRWREPIHAVPRRERWWGIAMIAAGLIGRAVFADFCMDLAEMGSFLLCLAGAVTVAGGWPMFHWMSPVIALLILLLPLPWGIENVLFGIPQVAANGAAAYLLQLFGFDAYRNGNVIFIGELSQGILDPCNRLRLVLPILGMALAILMWTNRRSWEQLAILAGAIVFVFLVNVVRIAATALAIADGHATLADALSGTTGNWLMFLTAAGLLIAETWLLGRRSRKRPAEREGFPASSGIRVVTPGRSLWSCGGIAAAVIVAFGSIHYFWTQRSAAAAEAEIVAMVKAVQSGELPDSLGDWEGDESDEFERAVLPAGTVGKSYRYRHLRTHREISVFMLCGPAHAVAQHQPSDCYPNSSLRVFGVTGRGAPESTEIAIELNTAKFLRERPTETKELLVSWLTMSDAGWSWRHPSWSFEHFGGAKPTLKTYLIFDDLAKQCRSNEGPTLEFVDVFRPEAHKIVFPTAKPSSSDETTPDTIIPPKSPLPEKQAPKSSVPEFPDVNLLKPGTDKPIIKRPAAEDPAAVKPAPKPDAANQR